MMTTTAATALFLTIVALGDSITAGPRPATAQEARRRVPRGRAKAKARRLPPGPAFPAYGTLIGQALGGREKTVNAGVGGDTTAKMLARFDRDVAAHSPRVVLIMAGMNDAAYVDPGPVARAEPRVALPEFARNLALLVERVRRLGAQPVLLTSSPMTRAYVYQTMPFYQENDINDGLSPFVDATRRVARESGACLADIFGDWIAQSREHRAWIPDGIHPNAEGHRRIAAQVLASCGAVLRGERPAARP